MDIKTLHAQLSEIIEEGYGDKDVYSEDAQEMVEIDSVQMNTCPGDEPHYFFIMSSDIVDVNEKYIF